MGEYSRSANTTRKNESPGLDLPTLNHHAVRIPSELTGLKPIERRWTISGDLVSVRDQVLECQLEGRRALTFDRKLDQDVGFEVYRPSGLQRV